MGDHVIALREGETAVVGYGSLLSSASVSRTLQREYDGPFVFAEIADWRRSWDVSMPNAAFYYNDGAERGLSEAHSVFLCANHRRGERMNCAIFVARDDELPAMHGREWIYTPTVITDALRRRARGRGRRPYVCRPTGASRGGGGAKPTRSGGAKSYLALPTARWRWWTGVFVSFIWGRPIPRRNIW